MAKQSIPPRMGTCYVDTYRWFTEECDFKEAFLVHAVLHGRNDLEGWVYGHAFIEVGDTIIQPKWDAEMGRYDLFFGRKEYFYKTYQMDEKKLRRYSFEQALEMAGKHKNYGAWHQLGLGKQGFRYKPASY